MNLIRDFVQGLPKNPVFTVGIGPVTLSGLHVGYARITHKETYFRAEYVPTWTFGLRADTHGSYATPAQGRITHKYVIPRGIHVRAF